MKYSQICINPLYTAILPRLYVRRVYFSFYGCRGYFVALITSLMEILIAGSALVAYNPFTGVQVRKVGHLTRKSGVLGSIPGLATYFRFSFRFFKRGSCQFLAKVCARSTC